MSRRSGIIRYPSKGASTPSVQKASAKTADLARRHGVSEATIYNCKAKDGGLVSEAKRLRACRVIGADRKSMRYRSQREDDVDLRSKLREFAQQPRRFGYRRLKILLRREGVVINRKKTQRLYSEE